MEETIQFIYQEIRNHNINIGGQINDIFSLALRAQQIPVIQNNFDEAITLLTNQNILEERGDNLFLTEHGFSVIYNR